MTVSGWLFDAYLQKDKMVFWIRQEDGTATRLEENWFHPVYIGSDDKSRLKSVLDEKKHLVKGYEFVQKYEKLIDAAKSDVLKVHLANSFGAESFAKEIMLSGRYGDFRLYNIDVMPAQSYFYEHGIFPLAYCRVNQDASTKLSWTVQDNVESPTYSLPDFKTIRLSVNPQKVGKIPTHNDPLNSVIINREGETIEINGTQELEILIDLARYVSKLNPDFIFTNDGDWFLFPYLASRAAAHGMSLVLGRDQQAPIRRKALGKEGSSFPSYGRIYYRPTSVQLRGRIHIDTHNSFILNESGLQGLYEVARVCRMPLHKASRASIGRCMSSLQFYYATMKEILIPWRPNTVEHRKSTWELLIADRGGTIFEPQIGVFEHVGELDFVSLYPSMMAKKNLSGETVLCDCCQDSEKRVPELNYHICKNRLGITPLSLEILLTKRVKYKAAMKYPDTPPELVKIYNERQTALKWILVTSFGYLGYSNSKFGRIDAHIATCAFDRQVLMQAVRVAESQGFIVPHGIVDSLWVIKQPVTKADYLALKDAIEKETGFAISFEGEYKWIAFVHSKSNDMIGVPNRYFGVFDDGKLKVRGLGQRRHDTPALFAKCEQEILDIMAAGNSVKDVRDSMPMVRDAFQKYVQLLKSGNASLSDLIFRKQISKESDEYRLSTVEASALKQLEAEGRHLHAGETLRYVITDYSRKQSFKRSVPVELIDSKTTYDKKRYVQLLADIVAQVTEPFGCADVTRSQDSLTL